MKKAPEDIFVQPRFNKMLKIPGEATLPMPFVGRKSSEGFPGEHEYKDFEEEMGYQQTLMYGRYSRY
jgi:hypothetical protein